MSVQADKGVRHRIPHGLDARQKPGEFLLKLNQFFACICQSSRCSTHRFPLAGGDYLRHRGVAVGAYKKMALDRPKSQTDVNGGSKTATVLLTLRIENNSKFVRGKKRVKDGLERYLRQQFTARLRPSGRYELKVPHRTDEDLDKAVGDLLQQIAFDADQRNCFSESDAQLEGSDRSW
jgi:hypothetical protein